MQLPLKKSFAIWVSALLVSHSAMAAEETIRLNKGPLSITLDPTYGGRITELRYGERNLLDLPQPSGNNFGSTFWLSPQSLWNWPPVVEHDSAPYQVSEQSAHAASMQSNPAAGASVSKTVTITGEQSATVQYRIDAQKDFPEIAAWEITRVAKRGVAFAPVTIDSVKTVRGKVPYQLQDNVLWLPLNPDAPLQEGKVIANGTEGWLAYTVDQLLYLKVYPKVAMRDMATGEGDIELYLSGEKPYLELEVQSAAHPLKSGDALDWTVEWWLAPIPENIEIRSGSPALLKFVRQQLELASSP